MMTASTAAGKRRPGRAELSGIGGCDSSCENISRGFFATYGWQPVRRKYAIVERLYWSAFGVTTSPESASGATYIRVPTKNPARVRRSSRSEEHTSELQSRQYLVCSLLLEKKKTKNFSY